MDTGIDGLFSSASEDSLMTTGTIQLATLLSGRSESLKLLGFLVWYVVVYTSIVDGAISFPLAV